MTTRKRKHPKLGVRIPISSIYIRGDVMKRERVQHWSTVPKNSKPSKARKVNRWVHMHEQEHGYVPLDNLLERIHEPAV